MKGTFLGEFEELVLLTVGILEDQAYGLSITDELERRTGRSATISSVHKALVRLEEKGHLVSHMGGATEQRGGRQKKLYQLTNLGKSKVRESFDLRNSMFNSIPSAIWE